MELSEQVLVSLKEQIEKLLGCNFASQHNCYYTCDHKVYVWLGKIPIWYHWLDVGDVRIGLLFNTLNSAYKSQDVGINIYANNPLYLEKIKEAWEKLHE